jgi:hypothetical protein
VRTIIRRPRPRPLVVLAFFTLLAVCAPLIAGHIEAVRGKQYGLTKRHGPWMIMVASFNKPPEYERTEGMSPEEAANQLVYELRLKGIPAYTFQQTAIDGTLTTIDRRTNAERAAKTRNWAGGICVLAGNYPTSNDKIAQRTLKFIKSFQPEFLRDVTAQGEAGPGELIKRTKSGGVYHVTPNHRFPFSGAFMSVNPELTDEDLALRKHDPFILRLNSGSDYSLLTNPGRYTIVVATFQGKAELTSDATEKKVQPISSSLSEAADRAWQLCMALRRAKSYGYDRDYDAWVFHDRYTSIVTVGSFKSKDDPRIAETQNLFGAKISSIKSDGSPNLGAEAFAIPRKAVANEIVNTWIFDPFPQIIEVPR